MLTTIDSLVGDGTQFAQRGLGEQVPVSPQSDDYPLISGDLTLLCRAINQGWEMPAETRSDVVKRLAEVIRDPDSTKREVTRAAMALIQVDKLKLQSVATAKSVLEKAPPVVIIQQAAQDDGVRKLIESASEEQLAVIADLLRASSEQQKRQSDPSRESSTPVKF